MRGRISRAGAVSLTGLDGAIVTVEAAVSQQLPGMAIIGLPDASLAEARLRVKLGVKNAGFHMSDRFITVNLSPAALPKHGSGFDLAIALAVLDASGHALSGLDKIAHIGELALDGSLRRPRGLLGLVLNAKRLGFRTVLVPRVAQHEARLVPDLKIIGVDSLRGAVNWYLGSRDGWTDLPGETPSPSPSSEGRQATAIDMADVIGQPHAIEALMIAATGKHHLKLVGPPGAGKSMLAMRLPTILPDLMDSEAIEASTIASLATEEPLAALVRRPPFEAPHHTSTTASIIGSAHGGIVRPGAVTRASRGVLFLDEAGEFPARVLDALRQPLERGTVELHRAQLSTTLPAAVQLVLASNPCPCGYGGAADSAMQCDCSPHSIRRYQGKISGPLRDRIDMQIGVNRVSLASVMGGEQTVSSTQLRQRVLEGRQHAQERLRGTPWQVNSEVPGPWLRSNWKLARQRTHVIDQALAQGRITLRGYDRILRLAWTMSDLAGQSSPLREDVSRALMFREKDWQ